MIPSRLTPSMNRRTTRKSGVGHKHSSDSTAQQARRKSGTAERRKRRLARQNRVKRAAGRLMGDQRQGQRAIDRKRRRKEGSEIREDEVLCGRSGGRGLV